MLLRRKMFRSSSIQIARCAGTAAVDILHSQQPEIIVHTGNKNPAVHYRGANYILVKDGENTPVF